MVRHRGLGALHATGAAGARGARKQEAGWCWSPTQGLPPGKMLRFRWMLRRGPQGSEVHPFGNRFTGNRFTCSNKKLSSMSLKLSILLGFRRISQSFRPLSPHGPGLTESRPVHPESRRRRRPKPSSGRRRSNGWPGTRCALVGKKPWPLGFAVVCVLKLLLGQEAASILGVGSSRRLVLHRSH